MIFTSSELIDSYFKLSMVKFTAHPVCGTSSIANKISSKYFFIQSIV